MTPSTAPVSLLARLRSGGIRPEDSADERLNKSLLVLATGLVCVASTLWLAVYWSLGPRLSATLPFAYQLLLAGNLAFFLYRGNFRSFRVTQLGLFLFAPFAAQWAIGNFITASGILLWGLLAPIGAILCIGARESLAWFFAYAFLVALTGFFDYYLADAATYRNALVPVETSVVFFALNFLAVSSIVFMLLRFAIEQKQIIARRLAAASAAASRSGEGMSVGIAGRSRERLSTLRDSIAAAGLPAPQLIIADVADAASLQAMAARGCNGGGMHRPRVAIQNDVCDAMLRKDRLQTGGPCLHRVAERDIAFPVRPKRLIPAVEADAMHGCTCRAQHLAQTMKERAVWPLKEKEAAALAGYSHLAPHWTGLPSLCP